MIREEFFPTSVFGKDIKLDNDKLAQDIFKLGLIKIKVLKKQI